MSDDPCTIGIMHPAFAVSKIQLLNWIDETFGVSYAKVEACASGAIYCQICDAIYGKVPMSKVKWDAKSDYEFIQNWRFVQASFKKEGVSKGIPIEKLVKAKFQDNLEFLQWMKHFYNCKYDGHDYDAKARRDKGKGTGGLKKGGTSKGTSSSSARPKPARKTTTKAKPSGGGGASEAQKASIADLKEQIASLQKMAEGMEKERDFYYGKLREVEIFCQEDAEGEGDEVKEEDSPEAILEWLNTKLSAHDGLTAADFTEAFKDPRVVCGLVEALKAGSFEMDSVNDESVEQAFNIAESSFSISATMSSSDLLSNPVEEDVLKYVTAFRTWDKSTAKSQKEAILAILYQDNSGEGDEEGGDDEIL